MKIRTTPDRYVADARSLGGGERKFPKTPALEGKGRDAVMSLNRLSVLMATNSDHAVRASEDERRYFVVEVSDKHQRDQDYFTALWGEIGGEGPAAMLHDLLAYDLAGWAVQQVPQTKALAKQKLLTFEGHARWWYGQLCEGSLQGASFDDDWEASSVQVEKRHFYEQYLAFADRDRNTHSPLSNVQFHRKFRVMCAAVKETRPRAANTELQGSLMKPGARQLSIPDLATCRAGFEKFIGQELGWDE